MSAYRHRSISTTVLRTAASPTLPPSKRLTSTSPASVNHGVSTLLASLRQPFPCSGLRLNLAATSLPEEDRYGSDHVVLLSHALWQSQYGSAPDIVGKTIHLDETAYTVIGVMPASFRFPLDAAPPSERASLWLPMAFAPNLLNPDNRTMEFGVGLIGRLKPGVSTQQAQAEMNQIANRFMLQYGYSGTIRVAPHVYPFSAHSVASARPLLILLAASVLCVLLIASANIANLLLARASARTQEMALRMAIGASRPRLIRQCLVESSLLGFLGSIAGIFVAIVLGRRTEALRPNQPAALAGCSDSSDSSVFCPRTLTDYQPVLWICSRMAPFPCSSAGFTARRQAGQFRSQRSAPAEFCCNRGNRSCLCASHCRRPLAAQFYASASIRPLVSTRKNAFVVRTVFDHVRYPDPLKRDVVQKAIA